MIQAQIEHTKALSRFTIVPFEIEHLDLYYKCFDSPLWLKLYGVDSNELDVKEYINKAVLTKYLSVERVIVLNQRKCPILFAHLCYEDGECFISGGIIPELINSGIGVYCSAIVMEYVFSRYTNIDSILVTIFDQNPISLHMIKKFGFHTIKVSIDPGKSKMSLRLIKSSFPNSFLRQLLLRINHD